MQADDAPVLIVGGGAAGLSSAAALARRDVPSIVLDQNERIGESWSGRYNSLRLHTIRRFSGLAHYPIPKDRPRYLSKDDYAAYLQEYVQVMKLRVSLGERVTAVKRTPSGTGGSAWQVTTTRCVRHANVVVIATGQCAEPHFPSFEGMEQFCGRVLHSARYTSGAEYRGQKVLVIGLGNSGAEIASDLARHGARSVSVSVRTPPPIVAREMLGLIPVQLLGIALMPLGMPQTVDRIGAALRRMSLGDLAKYGLSAATWGPFTAHRPAVIDTGFVHQLKQGRIAIRPTIAHFDSDTVFYSDGSSEKIDVVIAATGFRTGLEKFLHVPDAIDEEGRPRFRSSEAQSTPGLFFIGFDETVRGQLFEIERASRRLAALIERDLKRASHPG